MFFRQVNRFSLTLWTMATIGASAVALTWIARADPATRIQDAKVADDRRPPAGSLLAFRITADDKHDAGAIEQARKDDLEKPPSGYTWAPVDGRAEVFRDGLILREGKLKSGEKQDYVLLKLDPQNVTERDLARVAKTEGERRNPAVSFFFNQSGGRRFGELTRAHLPEDGGMFKYRVAILVEGRVVSCPAINSEVNVAGIIEMGSKTRPEEVDRLVKLLSSAITVRELPTPAIAVRDQEFARHAARELDLPALDLTDRVTIEPAGKSDRIILTTPESIAEMKRALKPTDVPPSGGLKAATLTFSRGDDILRKVWVYEGGEWGFERPGTSWTVGSSPELWAQIKKWMGK
jgi:hypothetical protein